MFALAVALLFAVKGTICFSPPECAPATTAKIDVTPSDAERRFVWISEDGAKVVLGTLPAKAGAIDLEAKEPVMHDVTLTLRGDAHRGWPSDARFMLSQGPQRGWRWIEPAKAVAKPVTIRVPQGTYQLLIGAEHHQSDRRTVAAQSDVALHDITLAPLPVITGRVVTSKKTADDQPAKDVPVANAQILSSEVARGAKKTVTVTKAAASTNEQGSFRAELEDPEASEIVVTYPGLATRLIPLALTAPDTDLGVIRLSSGAKLTAHLDRADSVKSKTLHVTLYAKSPAQYENTFVEKHDATPGSDDVIFADLGEGEYYVVISGDEVLENLTTVVAVKHDDVSLEIRVAPFTLAGTVKLGEEPLHEGRVSISDRHHSWRAEVPIDADGKFGGTIWQRDDLGAFVTSKTTGALPVDHDAKLEGDPAPWDIRFPRRLITGRLFDEETRQPVEKATLRLELSVAPARNGGAGSRMKQLHTGVAVADDGTYSIVAVQDGVYDLQAAAPGHIALSKSIEVSEADASKTADFPLGRGVEQPIEFVWPTGEPVIGAMVLEGVARDGYNPGWYGSTDGSGKLRLRSPDNQARTLFVIPREGSFAPVHVPASTTDAEPMRVVVPAPAAGLTINMVTSDRKPARGRVEMRYNGDWVPNSAVVRLQPAGEAIGSLHFARLPSGAYELWAEPSSSRTNAAPSRPPERVGLSNGEQAVVLEVPQAP